MFADCAHLLDTVNGDSLRVPVETDSNTFVAYDPHSCKSPEFLAAQFTMAWRKQTFGEARARGTVQQEKEHYLQMIKVLDMRFTRDSVEAFCLSPRNRTLVFLDDGDNLAPGIPAYWPAMLVASQRRFRGFILSHVKGPQDETETSAVQYLQDCSPEDILALRESLWRWQSYGRTDYVGRDHMERIACDEVVKDLRLRYEENSVLEHLEDPFRQSVLRPLATDNSSRTAVLDQPWRKQNLVNEAWLLQYFAYCFCDPDFKALPLDKLEPAQQMAILDGEWRRQKFGNMWAKGSVQEEEQHHADMREDLDSALRNLKMVKQCLADARASAPSFVDAQTMACWSKELEDALRKKFVFPFRQWPSA